MLKLALALAALLAAPATASTYTQGDLWAGQLNGTQTLTFSAPYATPCGNGNYSGCSYQAGGSILAVKDLNNSWDGIDLGSFNIDAYKPMQSLTIDFTKWVNSFIVVHFTGQNPVNFTTTGLAASPAPVPLPAAAVLLLSAFGGLAGVRRLRHKA